MPHPQHTDFFRHARPIFHEKFPLPQQNSPEQDLQLFLSPLAKP
jgi:hypothetical protein